MDQQSTEEISWAAIILAREMPEKSLAFRDKKDCLNPHPTHTYINDTCRTHYI
jgi:hypothetical protein